MHRKTIVSIAAFLTLCLVAVRQADALSSPTRDPTASCVTAESFHVLLLRPQELLSRWGAGDSQSLLGQLTRHAGEKLGFGLRSIRQIAFIFYNDAPPDATGLTLSEHTGLAVVVQLSEPADVDNVVSRFAQQRRGWRRLDGNAVSAEHGGSRYYKCGYQAEGIFGGDQRQRPDECLWFLDERTFLFTSEHWLHKIIDARGTTAPSRLAAWIQRAGPALDGYLAADVSGHLRLFEDLLTAAFATADDDEHGTAAPLEIDALFASLDLTRAEQVHFVFQTPDTAAAARLLRTGGDALVRLKQQAADQFQSELSVEDADLVLRLVMAGMTDKLINGLALKQDGSNVVLTVSDLDFLTGIVLVNVIGSTAKTTFDQVADELGESDSTFEDVPAVVPPAEPPKD